MGYTTDFEGRLRIEPTLRPAHRVYLQWFAQTRRMKRDPWRVERMSDPVQMVADLPIGPEGAYSVGSVDDFADNDPSVIDANTPHAPLTYSLYCSWAPSEDGSTLSWNGAEKFYEYATWLQFLIEHFLRPWGYRLNGQTVRRSEDFDDQWSIVVRENAVAVTELGA